MSALAATAGPAHDAVDIREAGDGVVRLVPTERAIAERLNAAARPGRRRSSAAAGGIRISPRRRCDASGPDRILVIAPGLLRPEQLAHVMLPVSRLEFRLVDVSMTASAALQSRAPEGSEVLYAFKTREPYLVRKQSTVGGRDITDARLHSTPTAGRPSSSASPRAAPASSAGSPRRMSAVPSPSCSTTWSSRRRSSSTPILGGFGQITGNFTVEEANRLAVLLRAGALPVKLIVVEQTTVPPAPKN